MRIVSSVRKIAKNKTTKTKFQHRPQSTSHGRIELDTHADTTVLGSNCVVLSYTGKECEVSPYSSQYEAVQNVPVVTEATVWTNAADGTAYLLIFHESLWMGDKLDHTLVNPNQLRAYGVSVQDKPFDAKPLSITTNDISVKLYSEGTIICGDTQTPTESELSQLPHLILTSLHDWDPHNICFLSSSGQSSDNMSIESNHSIFVVDTLLQHTIHDPIMVASLMSSHVQVAEVTVPSTLQDVPLARTFQPKERHSTVTPSDLSERWYIGLGQATQTLKATTQRLMCSTILLLAQQYHADRMFVKPRIHGTIYTGTMNGGYKSLDGNKHAQIFANESFFATAYPMEHKSSTGQALKQFISDFGIPDKLVCDGAAEQVGKRTEFQATVRKHAIDLHVTEPHCHNQSKVEGVVQEIRKSWFRIMLKKKVPKQLWGLRVCEVMNAQLPHPETSPDEPL